MSDAKLISLAERLKQRREELGLSQAQAARELDVARTAYRLWEMEAAKPQPDRWRLISRWLGVSVTTMLLAELDGDGDRSGEDTVEVAFRRAGHDWDEPLTDPVEFFRRAHELVREGTEKGFVNAGHADELLAVLARIQEERLGDASDTWEPTRLVKELRATKRAPRAARAAVAFAGADLDTETLQDARLLTSELVSNSVKHGPGKDGVIGVLIDVSRERVRVEVTDSADASPRLGEPHEDGGYGLLLVDRLASRWRTSRLPAGNLTWFEIDLAPPGTRPERP